MSTCFAQLGICACERRHLARRAEGVRDRGEDTFARILEATLICSQHAGVNKTIYTLQSECVREALVRMRQKAGLNQRQLARKLRREHSLVSRLELGERRVDVAEFYWICRACGAEPSKAAAALMREFARMEAEG